MRGSGPVRSWQSGRETENARERERVAVSWHACHLRCSASIAYCVSAPVIYSPFAACRGERLRRRQRACRRCLGPLCSGCDRRRGQRGVRALRQCRRRSGAIRTVRAAVRRRRCSALLRLRGAISGRRRWRRDGRRDCDEGDSGGHAPERDGADGVVHTGGRCRDAGGACAHACGRLSA